MLVRVCPLDSLKLGVVSIQLAILGHEVQAFKVVSRVPFVERFGEAQPHSLAPTISITGLGSGLKKYSSPTLNTSAMRKRVGSVVCIRSRSSFDKEMRRARYACPTRKVPCSCATATVAFSRQSSNA